MKISVCFDELVLIISRRDLCKVLLRFFSFVSLKELHVSLNGYKTVDITPECVLSTELEKLYMNEVQIETWTEISKLGHAFPSLQSMTIIESPISRLTDDLIYSEFSKLHTLNITNCRLSSWEEIDKIRRFPCLQSLRISDVPFFEVCSFFVVVILCCT